MWYIKAYYNNLYQNIYNDEFKIDEVKSKKLPELKKKLENVKSISSDQKFTFKMPGSTYLEKYDFTKKGFLVKGVLADGTSVYFGSRGERGLGRGRAISLNFSNIDESKNFIPMEKAEAKKLKSELKKAKIYEARINTDYIYTITDYDAKQGFDASNNDMEISIQANLISVEYSYVNRKKERVVIAKFDFTPAKVEKTIEKVKEDMISPNGYSFDGYSSGMTLKDYMSKQKVSMVLSSMMIARLGQEELSKEKERAEDIIKNYDKKIISKDVKAGVFMWFTGMEPHKLYSTFVQWKFDDHNAQSRDAASHLAKKLILALTTKYGEPTTKTEIGAEWKSSKTISIKLSMAYSEISLTYKDLVVEQEKKDYIKAMQNADNSAESLKEAESIL